MTSTEKKIQRRICKVISSTFNVPINEVKPETCLVNDLEADSLSLTDLMLNLEDVFEISFPNEAEEKIIVTQIYPTTDALHFPTVATVVDIILPHC